MPNFDGNVYNYTLEPTSPKGLHRYFDFYSMLPDHFKRRTDLMKIIYMLQDYLNDGYRKIPEPTNTHVYKISNNSNCGIVKNEITLFEYRRPYNHDTSMYKGRITEAFKDSFSDIEHIDDYDKERDLSTWAFQDGVLSNYIKSNSENIYADCEFEHSYYLEPKIWKTSYEFYRKLKALVNENPLALGTTAHPSIYISTPINGGGYTLGLDEKSITLPELIEYFNYPSNYSGVEFYYFACNLETFKSTFESFAGDTNCRFSLESKNTPYFYGISEDLSNETRFPTLFNELTFDEMMYILPSKFNGSFRIKFKFNSSSTSSEIKTELMKIVDQYGSFAFNVNVDSLDVAYAFSRYAIPCIASSLLIIQKYQHPELVYSTFASQNVNRHDAKKASLAEKIYRLAYMKDASVVDYEYINLISQHFGYSIDTDEDEINSNTYYKTKAEKEAVVRKIVGSLPEFNRMKGTDNAIEMVLLSFGIVGKMIQLYTIGDERRLGYAGFVDARIVTGDIDEYAQASTLTQSETADENTYAEKLSRELTLNSRLSGTSIDDWYPSPHFRIEIDMIKDNLNILKSSIHFKAISKTIKKIKPINTVFQGFYATLMAEYAGLFLHKPLTLTKVYQIAEIPPNDIVIDEWNTACGLEFEG